MVASSRYEAWAPSAEDPRVQRDIFPLRLPATTNFTLSSGCRASQRRQLRRRNFDAETCFSVESLNVCYAGHGSLGKYSSTKHRIPLRPSSESNISYLPISAAQASVLHHVSVCVETLGPPPWILQPQEPLMSSEAQRSATMVTLPVAVLLAIPLVTFLSWIPPMPLFPFRTSGTSARSMPMGP